MAATPNTRATLLVRLTDVFLTRGYEGATLNELARAAGVGKASLYHHFPGGKQEMAAALLREAVSNLERYAFRKLGRDAPPVDRLRGFVDGFSRYVADGEGHCMIAVIVQGSGAELHGETVALQYRDWLRRLAAVFEETGTSSKRAERLATDLLDGLYGHLLGAKLLGDPRHFRRGAKRLKKTLPG